MSARKSTPALTDAQRSLLQALAAPPSTGLVRAVTPGQWAAVSKALDVGGDGLVSSASWTTGTVRALEDLGALAPVSRKSSRITVAGRGLVERAV